MRRPIISSFISSVISPRMRDRPGQPGIIRRVLDRPRRITLSWAAVFLAVFVVLGVAVSRDRAPLARVDDLGRSAEDWADEHGALIDFLRFVEVATGLLPVLVATLVVVVLLVVRGHLRAATYALLVVLSTYAVTTFVKVWIGRNRPDWQDPIDLLSNRSYPSGHVSMNTALMAVLCVLAMMFVRRSNMRRAIYVIATLEVLLVWADRLLLGRHYPSDVVGGTALAIGVALFWMAVYSPLPRSHAAHAEPLHEAIPSNRQLAVILNPSKVEDVAQFRSIVSSLAEDSGWSTPTWLYTTIEDPGTGMAEAAAVSGADLVLVCGGDGTVREVCAELAGTGIPVGIVPAGTGNLLARNLAIPLFIRAAIDVALNGQDRAIDLVEVSGDGFDDTHFMVMAGMGLDAAIMEGVNEDIKRKVGWIAYVLSGLKALMSPVVKVEIAVDGGEFTTYKAVTVVVGNVGFLQAGMPLLPDAAIDDGVLDVVVLHPKRFLSWLPLVARVLSKGKRVDETIGRLTGQSVVVRASADTPRQLDGDAIGPGRELRMHCVHGRLLVRVPR
jgi:YegS/Rv2252/BmrU family lipid kinase